MNKCPKKKEKNKYQENPEQKDNINICRQICGQSLKEKENMKKDKCEKNPETKKQKKTQKNGIKKQQRSK